MKIELNWFEPIELGSSNTIKENTRKDCFDFIQIPEISGVYIFYREYNQQQEPLYIGKSINIRSRMKQHFESMSLMDGLQNSKRGQKKLIFAEVKIRGQANLQRAIDQAEKGLIQYYREHNNLMNKRLMDDYFDQVTSTGFMIDLVNIETEVYTSKKNNSNF